jgi:hypothetical protein
MVGKQNFMAGNGWGGGNGLGVVEYKFTKPRVDNLKVKIIISENTKTFALFVCVGVMYSGEYADVCDRYSDCTSTPGKLKSFLSHGGNRIRDLWDINTIFYLIYRFA